MWSGNCSVLLIIKVQGGGREAGEPGVGPSLRSSVSVLNMVTHNPRT